MISQESKRVVRSDLDYFQDTLAQARDSLENDDVDRVAAALQNISRLIGYTLPYVTK